MGGDATFPKLLVINRYSYRTTRYTVSPVLAAFIAEFSLCIALRCVVASLRRRYAPCGCVCDGAVCVLAPCRAATDVLVELNTLISVE